jgi:hypothetical protein
MKIDLSPAGTTIKLSKSTRDQEMPGLKFEKNSCGLSKNSFLMYIVGRPKSGKSHFVESLLRHNYNVKGKSTCWDYIAYFCPQSSQNSYDGSFVGDMVDDDIYDELDVNTLNEAYENATETGAEGTTKKPKFSLIIIDDFAVELKDKGVKRLLLKMMRNHRHVGGGLSMIILSQNYMALDSMHRQIVSNLVMFDTSSVIEKERLWTEWFSMIPKQEFMTSFWKFIFDKKYNFIQCDRLNDFKITKNFQPIEIIEN